MNRAAYLTQPFEVSIETLAMCNARCTFCPYTTLDRKGVRMDTDLIIRLLLEMSHFEQPFFFSPFKVNEPLLDDRLFYILQTFERTCPFGRIRLFTNGSTLTRHNVMAISLFDRIEHLWISLNSCNAKDYEKIMGLNFENTCKKLDFLHKEKDAGLFAHPVVVSAVADDRPDVNFDFREFVLDRWPLFQATIIKRDGWLGYVEPSDPRIPFRNCSRWFELSVMATGKVALCCMDGTGEFFIGDVHTHTLLEIYNNRFWQKHRDRGVTRQQFSPCNRCTY